jgi:uncharacterized membrane protein
MISPLLIVTIPAQQQTLDFKHTFIKGINMNNEPKSSNHHFRFHMPFSRMFSVFGDDWFSLKAEAFARFFGTPIFLIAQTIIVATWIILNLTGIVTFDLYPFILLNLAFSLQAAYAAPLILLAQTRQADRDKVHAEADAQHRESLALASEERELFARKQSEQLLQLMERNNKLTEITIGLSERIESLTKEIHGKFVIDKTED